MSTNTINIFIYILEVHKEMIALSAFLFPRRVFAFGAIKCVHLHKTQMKTVRRVIKKYIYTNEEPIKQNYTDIYCRCKEEKKNRTLRTKPGMKQNGINSKMHSTDSITNRHVDKKKTTTCK